jgi:hypothetical protein
LSCKSISSLILHSGSSCPRGLVQVQLTSRLLDPSADSKSPQPVVVVLLPIMVRSINVEMKMEAILSKRSVALVNKLARSRTRNHSTFRRRTRSWHRKVRRCNSIGREDPGFDKPTISLPSQSCLPSSDFENRRNHLMSNSDSGLL